MSQITIQQAMQLAIEHHNAGQFQQAEAIYRQVLAAYPQQPDALHLLGVLAHQVGRQDVAEQLIRQALTLAPQNADAHSNLGEVFKAQGKFNESIAAYERAIACRPFSAAYYNMANVLQLMNRKDEARAAFENAIALQPNYPEAYLNLGSLYGSMGRFEQAADCCRKAIALRPDFAFAYSNLSGALRELGKTDEAIDAGRKAVALSPNSPEACVNLGNALSTAGAYQEAITYFEKSLVLNPNYADGYINLGIALKDSGRPVQAIAAYRRAIALNPNNPKAYNNLGNALREHGGIDEAFAMFERALSLDPNFALAHGNLGIAFKDAGRLDESVACFRRVVDLNPADTAAHGSLLLILHCHPASTPQSLAVEHRRWNDRHAAPLGKSILPHPNDRNPDRRLRIGYVSLDYREHPVGRFLIPFLANHDKSAGEIFAYAHLPKPDQITERLRPLVDHWCDIHKMSDAEVAERVRADRIDILVDLALHTTQNRLLVFARKPAPVQVTYLGYPSGTGMPAIDYRFTDPYLDPPGIDESLYAERTIRLADTFWCYDPHEGRDLAVSPLPAVQNGFITFGCLNNFSKVTPDTIKLWGRVMQRFNRSRLILLAPQGKPAQTTLGILAGFGVSPDRVEFISFRPHRDYLATYHRIDLGLDSFPYNGHTTSLDSLWMGVPVVTLTGQTPVSRAGFSQLSNLRMTELSATTPDAFVEIAGSLASDLPHLANLRATLRDRMIASPLMDSPRHVKNIESIYREIWRTWCAS